MENMQQLSLEERSFVRGQCIAILFRNETNFYSVIRVKVTETNETFDDGTVTMVGMMTAIHEDDMILAYGRVVSHPKFGRQYQIDQISKERPSSEQGLVQYFSSDSFKGIGKKTAEKIVKLLGVDAIDMILSDETVLTDKVGLKEKQAESIIQVLRSSEGVNGLLLRFAKYNIPMNLATKILEFYKDKAWETIEENPYQLIEDIDGFSFGKADEIGNMLGFQFDHKYRIQAAMIEVLKRETFSNGHTYDSVDQLFDKANSVLGAAFEDENMLSILEEMVVLGKVFLEQGRAFLPAAAFAELGIYQGIQKKMAEPNQVFPPSEVVGTIGEYEEKHGISFASLQQEAIEMVISKPLSIITGGPGTGKTTVIRGILESFKELHDLNHVKKKDLGIFLCAPTGRAAKRMSEATQMHAMTIHKLLGYSPEGVFAYGEDQKLEGKLLIVDEFSMVDIFLAYQLFKAIPKGMQIVFVGDEDQLPSVGAGLVLKDLLRGEKIPSVRLKQIYRQSEDSTIIDLAYAINEGNVPEGLLQKSKDFSFIPRPQEALAESIVQICENALKKGYDRREIQVLAPMYRGEVGIDALNRNLQELFNPPAARRKEVTYGERIFRVGDKVLQLVNVVENNVFNGDFGEIVSITYAKDTDSKQDEMIVSFEGLEVIYTRSDFIQLTHAYCCSIHKSQGSEFKLVVMPISRSFIRMLKRNLIYTGVTRSKDFLVLCGDKKAFYDGIHNASENERRTTLWERFSARDEDDQSIHEGLLVDTDNGMLAEIKSDVPVQSVGETLESANRPMYLTESYIFSEQMAADELKRMEGFCYIGYRENECG